ncbi:BMP family ABC transporter substrate-binding protein [Marispirochaeta aestuarii]|uniref:BMP family ABC transporter substrate-binding protein n=1 Tax=Marispirochaeta aestuarii TaxID=1963862 RepID=A0A1Y1S3B6_9SPIO|nr:BMP family ABC transporter substrate-binding protein [Marispirochaeta aestuarii]ORC38459.1 BMP family ABC transporter substrate-binding protein [Marispirochaeta aestuarii]
MNRVLQGKLNFSVPGITRFAVLLFVVAGFLFLSSCSPKEAQTEEAQQEAPGAVGSIAVFVPGVVAGSPTYEMMVEGVEAAARGKSGVEVSVVEGGFNQGEWLTKLSSLAASGRYDLIVTSNPAMPEICAEVSRSYPEARFLVLDGHIEGNPSIFTFRFNQREQGYLAGYFAGLVAREKQAEGTVKVGLIAGQEYPEMLRSIRPGYQQGAEAAAGTAELDFRVVGNWYDAGKGSELAGDMFRSGVNVILAIAGGANQGVISAAQEAGKGVIWFDSSGYDVAPGTVIGSTRIYLDRAAREMTLKAIEGELPFGSAESVGIAEGYITFITDHPAYTENLSQELREKLENHLEELKNGSVKVQE